MEIDSAAVGDLLWMAAACFWVTAILVHNERLAVAAFIAGGVLWGFGFIVSACL